MIQLEGKCVVRFWGWYKEGSSNAFGISELKTFSKKVKQKDSKPTYFLHFFRFMLGMQIGKGN